MYTWVRRGELSFHFDATLDTGISTVLALARETDLMPVWNPYCKLAAVMKLASPLDLYAYADFGFSPLPVPPMFVVVHATVEDRTSSAGHWYVRLATSPPATDGGPDSSDRGGVPRDVLSHGEVRIKHAFGLLAAVPPRVGGPRGASGARTRVQAELAMDLTRLHMLGPIRFLTPPSWLVNIVTRVMIPGVWRACLEAIAKIHEDGSSGPIGKRLADDATGVYRRIRRSTRQPSWS